jgi:hypothetical protein
LEQYAERCFYCSSSFVSTPHVDHVIPWSFMAEDKVWNLVLACDDCNGSSGKSSKTPSDEFVEKLTNRNDDILGIDTSELPPRIRKDLGEWRGRDFDGHIQILIGRCRADGFGTWRPKHST